MDSYTTNAKPKENPSFTYQNLDNVKGFLKELNLQQYVAAFIDEGFESLPAVSFFFLFFSNPPPNYFELRQLNFFLSNHRLEKLLRKTWLH